MTLNELLPLYATHPQVAALAKIIGESSPRLTFCDGLHGSAATMVFAALTCRRIKGKPYLFVLNDEEEAGYFYHDLTQMLGDKNVLFFPSSYRRAVKYAQRDAANEVLRTQVLNALADRNEEYLFIVTYPEALSERVAPKISFEARTIKIQEGGNYDLPQLERQLLELGFRRVDYVYEPGEFAVRGSILDVFSYSSEYPYRVDFFGDDVETIRTFEVQTQLSKDRLKDVAVVPEMEGGNSDLVPVTDYLPTDALLVVKNWVLITDTIQKVFDEGFAKQAYIEKKDSKERPEWEIYEEEEESRCSTLTAGPTKELDKNRLLVSGRELGKALLALQRIEMGNTPSDTPKAQLHFKTQVQPIYHKNFEMVKTSFNDFRDRHYRIYIAADSGKQNERLTEILASLPTDVTMPTSASSADAPLFTPVLKTLHEGFSDEDLQVCFFTDHQIFDRFHKYNLKSDHARDAKMALTLKELMQFQPGDFIVHIDHGVGRFAGLVRMPAADGTQQEMIKLTYQNDDIVLVSIHSLHKLSKYKGREGEAPKLSRLGTGAWEKLKERTKKKIKDIARDLIKLYSKRKEEKGFAYSADTYLQNELEASFAYEDTPDQLKVTQEVKADMESAKPMDRLVCGDVGFGKTEIAVRAAMKAAADGKQVAVLVPTTVLALQHFKTFEKRLKNFPVRVDYLSRARTPKQVRELLTDLSEGKVDILVGTHKLIGKSVKFKDLGLLIIDEEQKFGVAVKEKLRQLKVNVDTLTMSATPIPRTLQFSLMGARDFSVIQTPPPNRRPIQTEVHTFSHEIIADAVNFEMSRNGQTYIVTHRVSALQNLKELVKKYVPDARVAIGHGQMPPAELEKIILGFANYDYDVLISTTIVENGIDISNANTIIIDAANHFGLSDLHQMRGRVGRSDRKAFCYLLAPPLAHLSEESRRRLQAIEEFSDLGSGIHIAMQDLDIRGAGNLLGAEQSGFIADLGYETYQKILAEAVSELKNDEFAELYKEELQHSTLTGDFFVDECNVECDLHAFFPETYVPGASERMLLYRELDGLTTDEQIADFRQRMTDRFGALPPEGEELLRIVPLRRLGRKVGAERLTLKNGRMTLYFVSKYDSPFYQSSTFDRLIQYATQNYRTTELKESAGKRRMVIKNVPTVERALSLLQKITE
ncbi:transcription-repair coupling factor [uncultured Alloprevotella sp.]|uniref:transcription-repair coupling factor n=1 Tax=uncultured Alloprevotella sp. TaxID=1283315 RepID=UPI00325FADCE